MCEVLLKRYDGFSIVFLITQDTLETAVSVCSAVRGRTNAAFLRLFEKFLNDHNIETAAPKHWHISTVFQHEHRLAHVGAATSATNQLEVPKLAELGILPQIINDGCVGKYWPFREPSQGKIRRGSGKVIGCTCGRGPLTTAVAVPS